MSWASQSFLRPGGGGGGGVCRLHLAAVSLHARLDAGQPTAYWLTADRHVDGPLRVTLGICNHLLPQSLLPEDPSACQPLEQGSPCCGMQSI